MGNQSIESMDNVLNNSDISKAFVAVDNLMNHLADTNGKVEYPSLWVLSEKFSYMIFGYLVFAAIAVVLSFLHSWYLPVIVLLLCIFIGLPLFNFMFKKRLINKVLEISEDNKDIKTFLAANKFLDISRDLVD